MAVVEISNRREHFEPQEGTCTLEAAARAALDSAQGRVLTDSELEYAQIVRGWDRRSPVPEAEEAGWNSSPRPQ